MREPHPLDPSRREALYGLGVGLGGVALTAMLAGDGRAAAAETASRAADPAASNPLAPQRGHFPARAKSCIFLMMEGGPSHIDTFDPKPKLAALHMKEFQRQGAMKSAMESGKRYYVASPFRFRKHGQSGVEMSEPWRHLPAVADELCFYRGLYVDSVNHPTAMLQMNTGNRFGGDPAVGAWVTRGLGSLNHNLPGFVVLPETSLPQGGSSNWSNGFLPAYFQGTPLRPAGAPLLDMTPPPGVPIDVQRRNLDLLAELNARHAERHPEHAALSARAANHELAFRMQAEAPDLFDLSRESAATLRAYGVGVEPTDACARKCLLARRLVERGVRFVQLYVATWDSHDYLERAHSNLIRGVDRPIAALIADLRQRGLLDETLVLWGGEFGRSPDNGNRQSVAVGRDHNPQAMTVWLAGGGVAGGRVVGATDELGAEAVECKHHVRDLHVTLLKLLGLDDSRLTYFHAGRYKQLSQFGGQVIDELLA